MLVTGFRSPIVLSNAPGNQKAYMAEELQLARAECVFNDSVAEPIRTRVESYSSIAEDVTSGRILCPVPRDVPLGGRWALTLRWPALAASLALQFVAEAQPVECQADDTCHLKLGVLGCGGPLFGFPALEDARPGLVRGWFRWHMQAGVDRWAVYDTDGSFAGVAGEAGAVYRGHVNRWFAVVQGLPCLLSTCHMVMEYVVHIHCVYWAKGRAETAAFIPSPDEFLVPHGWTGRSPPQLPRARRG